MLITIRVSRGRGAFLKVSEVMLVMQRPRKRKKTPEVDLSVVSGGMKTISNIQILAIRKKQSYSGFIFWHPTIFTPMSVINSHFSVVLHRRLRSPLFLHSCSRLTSLSLCVTGVLTAVCAEHQPRSTQRLCSLFGFSFDCHPGDLLPPPARPPHTHPYPPNHSLIAGHY